MKELIISAPFFVAYISMLVNMFQKKIGNTFNMDVVVSSSNKPQALTKYLRLTLVSYAK